MDGHWRKSIFRILLGLFTALHAEQILAADFDELTLFGSIGGGYTHVAPKKGEGTAKNGHHLLLSGFGERGSENTVWQLGGGFFYNRIYSDGERDFPGSTQTTVRRQKDLRIETRAGEAEIAGRYRLGLGLEAGLLLRSMFGASLSFDQDKDSKAAKFFLGPQMVLRLGERSGYQQRLEISLLADLNVKEKSVYLLSAAFALGKSWARTVPPAEPVPAPEPPAPSPAPAPVEEERFEEILADKVINFPTGSSKVSGPAEGFLRDLGHFLKENPGVWKAIEVEGHTDSKGKLAYNMKLSSDRAQAVRTALMNQGAESKKLSARGFGPTRPLMEGDTPEALAANRRVVMIFTTTGREQRNALSQRIQALRKQYFNE